MILKEIMMLSYDIVTEYYRNNLEPFFTYLDEQVLWIGPADKQLLRSKEALVAAWSKEAAPLTFTMGSVTEHAVPLKPTCCCVILFFPVYTHYPDGTTQMHRQRIDLTWIERKIKNEDGKPTAAPRMVKIHISNGVLLDDRDYIYAVHSKDVDTNQIVCFSGKHVVFSAKDGSIFSFSADSVLWIEKLDHGRHTIVHTATEDVPSNKSTDYFTEQYPDVFLAPHKSYLVNPIHVQQIRRFSLILKNGKTLPIPEKKYTKFKAEFLKRMEDNYPS